MKTIPAGQFKTHCLSLLDEVAESRQEVVITKRGKPVAKVVPIEQESSTKPSVIGWMKGTGVITGDIIGPTGEIWNADSDEPDPLD